MTRRARVTFAVFGVLMGLYSLLRLGFLLVQHDFLRDVPAGSLALAFVHGLRFDAAALVILNAPLLLLWNLGLPRMAGRGLRCTCFVLLAVLNVPALMLNVVDYGYFPMVQRRLLYEPFDRPGELLAMVPEWFQEYPLLVLAVLGAGALFVVGLKAVVARLDARSRGPEGRTLPTLASGAVLAALAVLGVRGGLQQGILRPADAFTHAPQAAAGYLTLNTTYTVLLSAVLKPVASVEAMPQAEAEALVASMLADPQEAPPQPGWPFLRERRPRGTPQRRNVVLVLMESWTGANVGPHEEGGRQLSRTPVFDALCREGLLFTHFLASGQKTNEAIPSVLTSVPSLFRRPVIGSRDELVRLRGLGSVLAEQGWDTSFHYAVERTVMGFEPFARRAGFTTYRSVDDYPDPDPALRDGRWGVFDHLYFLDTARWLDRRPQPFLALMFSLTPHDPYTLPADRAAAYAAFAHESGYQRCLRYSDAALGEFMDHARRQPWFADTLFVVTGDHTRFAPPNSYVDAFRVPLLLYAPAFVAPGARDTVGSHVDILPTVLDVLDLPARHASMGRSLLAPGEAFAVTWRDRGYAFFGPGYALLHDLRRPLGLYAWRTDRAFEHDLAAQHPQEAARLERRLLAWLQCVTGAVRDDRVWPAAAR
ncbi:MAG: LTA synthase family protein [Planctomycetia bacterium]